MDVFHSEVLDYQQLLTWDDADHWLSHWVASSTKSLGFCKKPWVKSPFANPPVVWWWNPQQPQGWLYCQLDLSQLRTDDLREPGRFHGLPLPPQRCGWPGGYPVYPTAAATAQVLDDEGEGENPEAGEPLWIGGWEHFKRKVLYLMVKTMVSG